MSRRLYGRVNFSDETSEPPELLAQAMTGRCLVDGRELKEVWFVDTEAGIVKTYDVLGDGLLHATAEPIDAEILTMACQGETGFWDMPEDGVMSKTIFGMVQLFAPDEEGIEP